MTRRALSLAVALGALGGAALVLSAMFITGPGKNILLTWALVVVGTTVAVRAERLSSFFTRFAVGLIAFVISSLALYVALAFSPQTSHLGLGGHAWRVGFIVALGALINLATASVAGSPEPQRTVAA